MPLDLTATAATNDARVQAEASALQAANRQMESFQDHANNAPMSTNVWASKLVAFEREGELLCKQALIDSGDIQAPAPDNEWQVRRLAFEDLWDDGRTAIYGALNRHRNPAHERGRLTNEGGELDATTSRCGNVR